jgi:sialic acid synthase|tara:strand:- start:1118 stop:1996 length:879 start_codon:yes stop_codon:yes gene_type:complete
MVKPKIIAEIGCNHKGDIEIAKAMISTAKAYCNVDAVKFQKRDIKSLLSTNEYNAPHPVAYNSYGKTYGEHREFLEFSIDQHKELKNHCAKIGIEYSSSVWDFKSALDIISIKPLFIKVPSACNLNKKLLKVLCKNFYGEIHLSLGMTTRKEEKKIINLFKKYDRLKDLVIYSCTSGYPVQFKDVCLKEISRLKKSYGNLVKAVGFSGHHLGIAVDLGAFMLGAEYIERHFTMDRTWKGTDHAASLEPDGLRKLVRDIDSLAASFEEKSIEILEIELNQRNKLKVNQILWEE